MGDRAKVSASTRTRRSRVEPDVKERRDEQASPAYLPAGSGALSAPHVLRLQQQVGNQAVLRLLVMREFEDEDKVAEGAVGQSRGFAEGVSSVVPLPQRLNESGLIDGAIGTGNEPHAFTDQGKVGEGRWIHTGGTGGRGNETTGAATLVAPIVKTKAPSKPGGKARAWVKKGTGTVKVKRSFNGVIHGLNGQTTSGNTGMLWMSPRAQDRIDKHERKHVKSSKELHDQHIAPLENRIWLFSGFLKATKSGADVTAAEAALKARIDWDQSLQDFQVADDAANKPMGTTDTNDTSDFYADYPTSAAFKKKTGAEIYEGVGASKKKKSGKQRL